MSNSNDNSKKMESNVDNSPNYCMKRYQMICQIQQFLREGCSYREIARRMGIGTKTIAKYRKGDPKELSMYGIKQSKLDSCSTRCQALLNFHKQNNTYLQMV